jgi:DHA2 family multidrug resistance protein
MVATLYVTLERQPLQLGLLREGDWFGIATIAVGLAALQAMLEESNKNDWFGSPFILKLAIVAAISLCLFVANELLVEKPLIRPRLLAQRSFGFGTVSAAFVGFALFGSVYLPPAYLGQVQHYNVEQIGAVLAWTGLPQLPLIPLVPKLMQRFDIRYVAFASMSIFAFSSFMNIGEARFLKHDADLHPIGRRGGKELRSIGVLRRPARENRMLSVIFVPR